MIVADMCAGYSGIRTQLTTRWREISRPVNIVRVFPVNTLGAMVVHQATEIRSAGKIQHWPSTHNLYVAVSFTPDAQTAGRMAVGASRKHCPNVAKQLLNVKSCARRPLLRSF